VLLELEDNLPLAPEQVQPTVSILVDRLRVEKEAAVRAKIAVILGQLGRAPSCNALNLAEDIRNLLNTESTNLQLFYHLVCKPIFVNINYEMSDLFKVIRQFLEL